MLTFKINMKDVIKVERELLKVKNALQDRREALQDIKHYMIERWNFNFGTQGSIYGRWPALQLSTRQRRSQEGFGEGPTLYRTGTMYDKFMSANQRGRVNRASVTWNFGGGDDEIMMYHHFGSVNVPASNRAGRTVRNPSRLLWDINGDDEDYAVDRLEEWVNLVFRRSLGA